MGNDQNMSDLPVQGKKDVIYRGNPFWYAEKPSVLKERIDQHLYLIADSRRGFKTKGMITQREYSFRMADKYAKMLKNLIGDDWGYANVGDDNSQRDH